MNNSESSSYRKRGRPKSNGRRDVALFYRDLLAVHFYNQARKQTTKHDLAVTEAVSKIRELYPTIKISETPVRRALAKFQPHDCPMAWIVSQTPEDEVSRFMETYRLLGLPEGLWANRTKLMLKLGIGPRPAYPRINACHRTHSSNSQAGPT